MSRAVDTPAGSGTLVEVSTLGKRLREARFLRDYGSRRLSKLCGRSHGYVERLESGITQAPQADGIMQLAQVLRVRYRWLLLGEEPRDLPDGTADD